MTDLTPLIQASQEATGPSRELDTWIWQAAHGFEHDPGFILETVWLDNKSVELPLYTASLDAIAALIGREFPDGSWEISNTINGSYAAVWTDDTNEQTIASGFSGFPAIAACIAFLSALQARGGANG